VVSVAQSSDLGKSFSAPVMVATHGKSLDAGSDARPQLAVTQNGKVFLAYAFFKDANWNAQINTVRSEDGGKTFSTPQALVKDGSSQRFPSLVSRPDGSIFIAWVDKRLVAAAKNSGQQRLGGSIAYSFSRDDGKTFEVEKIANESSCECCRIGAAVDPQGGVGIVYRAIFSGGIRDHATQVITASSTGQIRRVSNDAWKTDACPHHGPTIAISGSGKMHVAWFTQGSNRAGVFYANSSNRGETYSKPQRIGGQDTNVSRPYLLAIGQSVWLVWKEFDGQKTSVFLKQSGDDGMTWSKPALLSSTAGYSDHPLLINDGSKVYLSWLTREDGYQLIPLNSQ
jgi:Neuraminidase (sialidase)